ncbi:VOC family protein [Deinococcus pimensis]|uniref:VOC family protein n=1 Tax=Deinococcus pimensis TaxID=309888 RepID=UPI00048969BF|nr:VOC family protein [Deinococcus pimensis]
MITGLDHVQVCAPRGCEDAARAFFTDFLGLPELRKPDALIANGGAWFALPDGRQVHVGLEDPFTPARKAHACLRADDLDEVARRAAGHGVTVEFDSRLALRRLYLLDPWGNRWEIVEGAHDAVPLTGDA